MSLAFGLAIGVREIRLVALSRARVVYSSRDEAPEGAPLHEVLGGVLQRARAAHPAARRIAISMAPELMPVKRVPSGLALGIGTKKRRQTLRPIDGLFLGASGALWCTSAGKLPDGSMVIGALDESYCRILTDVASALRLRLTGVVPAAVALAHFAGSTTIVLEDGATRLRVEPIDGLPARIVLDRIATSTPETPSGVPGIQVSEDDPASWGDAIGSVGAVSREWCVLGPTTLGVQRTFVKLRPRLAATALALGTIALLVVPSFAASTRIRHQERYLSSVSASSARLAKESAERSTLDRELRAIREFDLTRPRWLPRMAALASAIPSEVFVISLRADSSGLELTIVGNDVGTIPDQIAQHTPFAHVEVVGSITHELVDGRQLQRVTLRCRTASVVQVIKSIPQS